MDYNRKPETLETIDFLKHLRPDGPWVLTAIVPDGPALTRTFAADQEDAALEFVRKQNADKNIYYSLNSDQDRIDEEGDQGRHRCYRISTC